MGIDKEKIAKRISDVQSAFNSLDKYTGINEAEFLNDDKKVCQYIKSERKNVQGYLKVISERYLVD